MFNFEHAEFFQAEEEARQDVRVDFGQRGPQTPPQSSQPSPLDAPAPTSFPPIPPGGPTA